jgi:hypothetical protein
VLSSSSGFTEDQVGEDKVGCFTEEEEEEGVATAERMVTWTCGAVNEYANRKGEL